MHLVLVSFTSEQFGTLHMNWFVTGRVLKGWLHCSYEMLPATWGACLPLGYHFVFPSLEDTKADCFLHSAIPAFKDNGLPWPVLSPFLFQACPFYSQPLWCDYQFAFDFLPANPHFFIPFSHMQTYFVPQICFLSATLEIQFELPQVNLI